MARVYKANEVSLLKDRLIFFDANVLIYIFWPTNNWAEKHYSRIFKALLENKTTCCIDYIVISEVANRIIRIEYAKYTSGNYITFKEFRDSSEGKQIISEVYSVIRRTIIKRFQVLGKNYSKSDLESFLVADSLDFSDQAIKSLCVDNNCILLTNDRDFKGSNIDLLSVNRALVG